MFLPSFSHKYEIKQKLGEEGFGEVCLAEDICKRKTIALKVENLKEKPQKPQLEISNLQSF